MRRSPQSRKGALPLRGSSRPAPSRFGVLSMRTRRVSGLMRGRGGALAPVARRSLRLLSPWTWAPARPCVFLSPIAVGAAARPRKRRLRGTVPVRLRSVAVPFEAVRAAGPRVLSQTDCWGKPHGPGLSRVGNCARMRRMPKQIKTAKSPGQRPLACGAGPGGRGLPGVWAMAKIRGPRMVGTALGRGCRRRARRTARLRALRSHCSARCAVREALGERP